MPFLGQDWRGPGNNWTKAGCSKWEIRDQSFGVVLETAPRSHVKKIIEAFLRQMQQKKNQSLYTNLTSAPVSKCSVREQMTWLQVSSKGSKEIHGYTTLGEMIRRLDLAGAAAIPHRFPYILEIADLLVRKKMSTLSGMAQSHLFLLVDALLTQVLETTRGIRTMQQLLNIMMNHLQHQSKRSLFSSKTHWFKTIGEVRRMQKDLKLVSIPQRVDNHATLTSLPIELQRQIVLCLNDYDDLKSIGHVNKTLRSISEEVSTWRNLCLKNYTEEEINRAKSMLMKKRLRQTKEKLKFREPPPADAHYNYLSPTTMAEWKNIHAWLRRTYDKREQIYVDPLLFCKRCSVLFWEVTGHPCASEVQNIEPDIAKLSPRRVISFFE